MADENEGTTRKIVSTYMTAEEKQRMKEAMREVGVGNISRFVREAINARANVVMERGEDVPDELKVVG